MPHPCARLDKTTGLRVLCGNANNTCGGQVAGIEIVYGTGQQFRRLVILPGWVFDRTEGFFRLTVQAAKRRHRAERMALFGRLRATAAGSLRRPKFRDELYINLGEVLEDGSTLEYYEQPQQHIHRSPVIAKCPNCGCLNELTVEGLRLSDNDPRYIAYQDALWAELEQPSRFAVEAQDRPQS